MTEENFVPSLEDLIYFDDDNETVPSFDASSSEGIDPTEQDIVDEDGETETPENDSEDMDSGEDVDIPEDDEDVSDIEESSDSEEDYQSYDEDDEGDTDTDTSSPYVNQFEFLKENGLLILPDDYEFDGSAEAFEKAVEDSRESMKVQGAQMIWDSLPEDFRLVLEYGMKGGQDINSAVKVLNKKIDLSDADLEDLDVQEQVMKEFYKRNTKYSDSDINRYIGLLEKSGALEEEATKAYKSLQQDFVKEKEELVKQKAKEKEEYDRLVKESYTKFNGVVDSMTHVPSDRKKKIVQSIWGNPTYGPQKNLSYFNHIDQLVKSNPEHLAQLTELYLDYDPEKGFNTEALTKKVESKINANFKSKLDRLVSSKPQRTGKTKVRKKASKKESVEALEAFLRQN